MAAALGDMLPWVLALVGAALATGLLLALGARRANALGRREAPACFRAAPDLAPGAPELRLTFLGDLQRGVSDVVRPLARELERRGSHLLVSSGDFAAHGEAPYYGTAFDAFEAAGIRTPSRVVPGNHDLQARGSHDATAGTALFEQRLGPRSWALRAGPVLLVGLDNALGGPPPERLDWLSTALAAHAGVPWLLVCHRPPRRVDLPGSPADDGQSDLVTFLEAHPPRLVVSGHLHEWAEGTVNGVAYVVNAHGGDVHGFDLRLGSFELLHVVVAPEGVRRERSTHRRRPWLRVFGNQFFVRCWSLGRRGLARGLLRPWQWMAGGRV